MTTHRPGTSRGTARREQAPFVGVSETADDDRGLGPVAAFACDTARVLGLYVIVPVLLLSFGAAAVGYVWLMHSPVPLKSFSKRIESRINASLSGFRADIDDAYLAIGADKGVELRITNLRIKEADGDDVVSAPEAAVKFSKAALWRLDAVPERINLIQPKLAVVYSDANGFSLSIANGGQGGDGSSSRPQTGLHGGTAQAVGTAGPASRYHRIDIAKVLSDASQRARQGDESDTLLRKFGVLDAIVSVTDNGRLSEIHVQEATVDLDHTARHSVISGEATISSPEQPWHFAFRMDEADGADAINLKVNVDRLVPRTLARLSPRLALLEALDMPMTGELNVDLSSDGTLRTADLGLDVEQGSLVLSSLGNAPVALDSGKVALHYDAGKQQMTLAPSTLNWAGSSRITLTGSVASDPPGDGPPQWHFDLKGTDGVLSAQEFELPAMPIDEFKAAGRVIPAEGLVQLSEFLFKAGGGAVTANGEVISGTGPPSTRIEAAISPMPLATLKTIWPRAVAPTARTWVGEQVNKASLQSASLKFLSGRFLETEDGLADPVAGTSRERLSASLEVADLNMEPLPRSLPIEAPRAILRMENSSLEVNVPEAAIIAGPEARLPLKGVRLTVVDVRHEAPIAELALKSQTTLPVLIETLNRSQLHLAGQGPLPIAGIEGKVDGELKISMPLVNDSSVPKAVGKARISEIRGTSKDYNVTLNGGTIDVEASDAGVVAKGDLTINGVLAKLNMHRILEGAPEAQPPLKITASLDNADRTQLGLDVNHLIQGTMPVEITVTQKPDAPALVHVHGDLTNAELLFSSVAWKKPAGKPASLDFDLGTGTPGRVDLLNFKVVGDNIAIDGSAVVEDRPEGREVSEFSFPNFSINVVSRLDVRGTMSDKRIWTVTAKGSTFEAKDVFRSMLALGNKEDEIKPRHPAAGVDFTGEIDTVIGNAEISLRKAKIKYSERADRIIALEADGTLEGGNPVMMELKPGGPRVAYAKASDAGSMLKMIGLYPNIKGGRMELEVKLDGQGAADKSGVLSIDNFRVLGDPIISEVYSSAEGGPGPKKPTERQVFEFQRMEVPFQIGHGQFVLDDSYLRGPLMGASIRGRVDFNAQRVNLGGTYIPLQGINAAVCDIPLFGPLVAGFDCQGVFGITYAIQGPMSGPEVIVNPLSMFTPGILRGIMELTSPNPQVQVREPKRPAAEPKVRASSTSPERGSVVDGWSSETTPGGASKKK